MCRTNAESIYSWSIHQTVREQFRLQELKHSALTTHCSEGLFVLTPIRGFVCCKIIYMLIMAKLFVAEQLFVLFTNEHHACAAAALIRMD